MKTTIITIMKHFKKIRGNSLAEFATTTALMATLAATAAPKLSELTETGRLEKSFEDIDKVIKQAGQFYQRTADLEGRGRFPNQTKFNQSIGGPDGNGYSNAGGSSEDLAHAYMNSYTHTEMILRDLGLDDDASDGWNYYEDIPNNSWRSVFGGYAGTNSGVTNPSPDGLLNEWPALFGDEILESPYQDGHYLYSVVAGGGTGDDVFPPVIWVVDMERARDLNNVLTP